MGLVLYYCAATLDGFIAGPDDDLSWLLGFDGAFEGEGAEPGPMGPGNAYERFYEGVGALVSGSATYEWVLEHVPEWPYGGKPYRVLSSRDLPRPEGEGVDVRIVEAPVTELHGELISAAGEGSLWVVGGGEVASQFAEAGLLDEVHVTVVPVALGAGTPIFARGVPAMRLLGTRTFTSGMVELRYAVGEPGASRATG